MAEYLKVCAVCGSRFMAKLCHARTCSNKCKCSAYRAANPEKKRKAASVWYANNVQRASEANRAWRAANPEKLRDAKRAYRRSKGPAQAAFHILNVMKKLKTEGGT
jgi:hypothetical protein